LKKATVSTAAGGVVEMLKDGETGFITPINDENALAERLIQLIDDEALRVRLGESFYEAARNNFSAAAMARTHKIIYCEIINKL
jgi:glycosyltransferase involved in cell wall biosynthesis